MRMLSVTLESPTQALGEEAINLLFEKHRLNRIDVIGLRETADAEVTRYTTRDILSAVLCRHPSWRPQNIRWRPLGVPAAFSACPGGETAAGGPLTRFLN